MQRFLGRSTSSRALFLTALSAMAYSSSFALVGCGGDASTGGGGTGGTTTSDGGGGATAGGGGTGGTTTSEGGGGTAGAGGSTTTTTGSGDCAPTCAEVQGVPSECVAITDNTGLPKFGLRMSQISFQKPTALTNPLIAGILVDGVTMNLPDCYLTGNGTFSWLVEIDKAAGTLKTGGAKPVAIPTDGYCFVSETLSGTPVTPLLANGVTLDAAGTLTMPAGGDVVIPVFLNTSGSSYLLLPLRQLRVVNAKVSADENCIGHYNADQLFTADVCEPSGGVTRFTNGGDLQAHMTLEDADGIIVPTLNQSLCVLLTGDAGDGQVPKKCARDGQGNIIAKGDWCSATDMAGGCMDSLQATGSFAASAVKINGDCP